MSQLTHSKYTRENGNKSKFMGLNNKQSNAKNLRSSFQSDLMINELDESRDFNQGPLQNFSDTMSLSDKVSVVIEQNSKKETWREKFEVFKLIYTVPML